VGSPFRQAAHKEGGLPFGDDDMKTKILLSMCAIAAMAAPAFARSAHKQPPSFLGKWALDVAKMPVTYGTPPKSVTYAFSDIGNGTWQTTIDIVMPDASVRHMEVRYRRDGQAVKGDGDKMEGDSAAVNSPAPNVLVMSLAKAKGLESVRVYAVSADGNEMTESAADVDDDGTPFVRNFRFTRIRG